MKKIGKRDLDKCRKLLEKQLKQLQLEMGQELPGEGRPNPADVNDQATLESERNFEIRIRDRERKLINKVQGTLRQISEGNYGTCESCQEPIGVKRLLARPVTTYCISCKSEMEDQEKQQENIKSGGDSHPFA